MKKSIIILAVWVSIIFLGVFISNINSDEDKNSTASTNYYCDSDYEDDEEDEEDYDSSDYEDDEEDYDSSDYEEDEEETFSIFGDGSARDELRDQIAMDMYGCYYDDLGYDKSKVNRYISEYYRWNAAGQYFEYKY